MLARLPIALLLALALSCPCSHAQEAAAPASEAAPDEAVAGEEGEEGEADEESDEEENEEPPVAVQTPTQAEVDALPAEARQAAATAAKSVLLQQMIIMLEEDHRMSRANFLESANMARQLSAPAPMEEAFRHLASGDLYPQERRGLNGSLSELYGLYGVDELAIRIFVETAGVEPEHLREIAGWLPLEHVFNLPPKQACTDAELQAQADSLCVFFPALKELLESAHDKESADAAAETLLPLLQQLDAAQALRVSAPQVQGRYFAPHKDSLIRTHQAIRAVRAKLMEADYFGSHRLQAVDYLMQ